MTRNKEEEKRCSRVSKIGKNRRRCTDGACRNEEERFNICRCKATPFAPLSVQYAFNRHIGTASREIGVQENPSVEEQK